MTWVTQLLDLLSGPFIWWVIIAPWETAIRTRLGKHVSVLGPGIHWRFPFVDKVFIQSSRLRMLSDFGQTMTTKDGKVVTVALAIQYRVDDIRKLFMGIAHPESTLTHRVQGLLAQLVSDTLSSDLTPKFIEESVVAQVPSEEWGLAEVKVWITSFACVKTFRLMMDDVRGFGANNDLDYQPPAK